MELQGRRNPPFSPLYKRGVGGILKGGKKRLLKNERILVIGMGKSGLAVAETASELAARVTVIDCEATHSLQEEARRLEEKGIVVRLGGHSFADLREKDLVVISPGVPIDTPLLIEARERGIPIWGEIELAYRLTDCPIIGITGTNGKTTTTVLTGKIFQKAGLEALVAGNIGFPLIEAARRASLLTWLIAEISSFQLESTVDFRPRIAVLLNITEDHLDRHRTFAQYVQLKGRLFLNQRADDYAIVNIDDQPSTSLRPMIKAKFIPFSKKTAQGGLYVNEGKILTEEGREICQIKDLQIKGGHNLDNCLAAAAVALVAGIPEQVIRESLIEFQGLEHRLEYVGQVDGVGFYNDSKATNPDATVKALFSFDRPVILLAGGRNKGNDFAPLAEAIRSRAKATIVFGESAGEIKSLLKTENGLNCSEVSSLREAVITAKRFAQEGDIILLSPACASFDMFSGYEERGKVFKEVVYEISNKCKIKITKS